MRELTLIVKNEEVLNKLGQLIFAAADENSTIFMKTCKEVMSSSKAGTHSFKNQVINCVMSFIRLTRPSLLCRCQSCSSRSVNVGDWLKLVSQCLGPGRLPGENWTLYMSNHDSALTASAVLHYNNRAGQVWPQINVGYKLRRPFVLAAGLECIDCSGAISPSLLG